LQISTPQPNPYLIGWSLMTDLALLQARIAAFAAQDSAPIPIAADWIAQLLDGLTGQTFDALHLHAGQIRAKHGAAQDMIPHAVQLSAPDQSAPAAFYCAAEGDPDLYLFCAARDGDMLVMRSRTIPINQFLSLWHATF